MYMFVYVTPEPSTTHIMLYVSWYAAEKQKRPLRDLMKIIKELRNVFVSAGNVFWSAEKSLVAFSSLAAITYVL